MSEHHFSVVFEKPGNPKLEPRWQKLQEEADIWDAFFQLFGHLRIENRSVQAFLIFSRRIAEVGQGHVGGIATDLAGSFAGLVVQVVSIGNSEIPLRCKNMIGFI